MHFKSMPGMIEAPRIPRRHLISRTPPLATCTLALHADFTQDWGEHSLHLSAATGASPSEADLAADAREFPPRLGKVT